MADVEKPCCAEPKECCKDESCCDEGKGPCHTDGKEDCADSCHKKPCGCKAGEDCKCKDGNVRAS